MAKFTIDAKELKKVMEQSLTAIDKKSVFNELLRLYFQVEEETLKVLGTDIEQYAEVKTENVWDIEPGCFGVDISDIKVLSKMTGFVTLETDLEKKKINVKCGKKNLTVPGFGNTDHFLPSMDETETTVLKVKENWLLDTLTKLVTFTGDETSNKVMGAFNFDLAHERVETLDMYRIGMRTIPEESIVAEKPESVMLHKKCVPVLKKIMDKKSEEAICISHDKKWVKLEGKSFTYMIRMVDGVYFNVDKMLHSEDKYMFSPDKDNMMEVMKFDADLNTDEKKIPVILHGENGKLYSYIKTYKYEALDEIKVCSMEMKDDFFIGVNPQYLIDALNVVDADYPVCRMSESNAPIYIDGDEYSFLILPINLKGSNNEANMKKKIAGDKVA